MSTTEIVKANSGVVLKRVTLEDRGKAVGVAYIVSVEGNPKSFTYGDLTDAENSFEREVERMRKAK